MVAPVVATAPVVTVLPWPSATLLPAVPAAMLAPCPNTVALALPLSVDWLPSTVEDVPVALAPKPPALAFAPLDTGCTAVTLLFDTNGPDWPLTIEVTFWFVANNCDPFTASVLVAFNAAGAMLVIVTGAPAPAPPVAPKVILVPPAASYLTAMFAVLSTFAFSAAKEPATVVCAVGPVTAPVLLTLLIGWLNPVILPVAVL